MFLLFFFRKRLWKRAAAEFQTKYRVRLDLPREHGRSFRWHFVGIPFGRSPARTFVAGRLHSRAYFSSCVEPRHLRTCRGLHGSPGPFADLLNAELSFAEKKFPRFPGTARRGTRRLLREFLLQ